MTNRDNHVPTQTEYAIKNYLEECKNNPKHGIATFVFPELSQQEVDNISEDIAEFLEDRLGVIVNVDI